MKADHMMNIIGEAREEYVQAAWESKIQSKRRRPLSFVSKMLVAAAIIMSLTVTVYATDGQIIKTLTSGGGSRTYNSFEKLEKAEKAAGFEIDMVEEFESGYVFQNVTVSTTRGLDDRDEEKLRYKDMDVELKNAQGDTLIFWAHQDQAAIPDTLSPVAESRQIGDVTVEYRVDNYRVYTADKEGNLTEEEQLWGQQPGNYISYFSGENAKDEAYSVAFLSWTKDGICCMFMDQDADESADILFAMAEELIHK